MRRILATVAVVLMLAVAPTLARKPCPGNSCHPRPTWTALPSVAATAQPSPTARPSVVPSVSPTAPPTVAPTPSATVTVTSLSALASALANDANTDITLAPGTYSGNFWVDGRFAGRTRPVVVHCAGATLQGLLTFRAGAHDQDWRGLTFANFVVNQAGAIGFGGYAGEPGPHHIAIRDFKVASSVRRTDLTHTVDHSVYFSWAVGGPHDILIENLDVDASGPMAIATGIHADHADATNANAWNVTIRNLRFRGNRGLGEPTVQDGVILWTAVHDWTFDGAQVSNTNGQAFYLHGSGSQRIGVSNFVSTNSVTGLYCDSAGCPGLVLGSGNSFQ